MIGNGDITCAEDAARMMEQTGCDGVMIGRASRGNPWIFRQVGEYLENGKIIEPPTMAEVKKMMLRHAKLQMEYRENTQESVRCGNTSHGIRQDFHILQN